MPEEKRDRPELGFYFALSQVGFEMASPIVGGALLDHFLRWTSPWATLAGVLLGFVGGLTHLVVMVNRHEKEKKTPHGKP